jgi:hypothetical protein
MTCAVLWDMMQNYRADRCQRFGGTSESPTLRMDAAWISEISVTIYQTTRRHIPEAFDSKTVIANRNSIFFSPSQFRFPPFYTHQWLEGLHRVVKYNLHYYFASCTLYHFNLLHTAILLYSYIISDSIITHFQEAYGITLFCSEVACPITV